MRTPARPLSLRRPRRRHITAEQLAALSHELRTPLNGVLGMARLLERTELTAEQRTYALTLKESGQHLLNLVNDLVDYAKLGAGKLELQHEPVDMDDLLRSVCELLAPRAREQGIELGWSAPRGLSRIQSDEGRLRQILLNFAGNAVKFTQAGGVLISVSEIGFDRLRFVVEDTGPGVPAEDRERIFEVFAQAEAARGQPGGAGLGLAITRSLAHAMDGEVGADASPLGGALFWFEAPFERPESVVPDKRLEGLTVAVASANPVLREVARRQIRACGARSVSAEDLEPLLARTEPGDVLLLDHGVAQASLSALPADRPAIVLLAADERDHIERYRQAGASGYLIKPLRRASLAERLLIVAGHEPEPAAAHEDERIAGPAAPGARVLLVEDNPINALLARALLAREGCEVDLARTGDEALAAVEVGAYDIILMDMRLPGASGEETTRRLRGRGVAAPIVALTANAAEHDRQACLAAGMNDFLVKPLAGDALRAVLTRWAQVGWTPKPARAKVG